VQNISLGAVLVLVMASLFLMLYTKRITRPLEQLTEATERIEKGNYDADLPYDGDDELGRLTRSFKKLSDNMEAHISDLNEQVFVDALTHVRNKGAFEKMAKELQEQIDYGSEKPEFAIGAFDCDGLKIINDKYGHDKGDVYLNTACNTISNVFKHSPVFRIGGDEFAVILRKDDYLNMEILSKQFDIAAETTNASAATEPWEYVCVSKGFAVFDPEKDSTVNEVLQRADKLMYENKRERKESGLNPFGP
jgi:diguanylate cyclase (GGDEF)-like protein